MSTRRVIDPGPIRRELIATKGGVDIKEVVIIDDYNGLYEVP